MTEYRATESEIAALRRSADEGPLECNCGEDVDACICATIIAICDELMDFRRRPGEDVHAKSIAKYLAEIERLRAALYETETVMMMVAPRSHSTEYRGALAAVRAALGKSGRTDD